ncbi:MAG: glycosyltransferase family 4 protein [Clostridia bacterium]|nr:glycosyltransferase family 4 protein [Clostridia bacterium]
MKVLILCGVFEDAMEASVIRQAKRAVEFSANLMQKKIIRAFQTISDDVSVLSAPFLGAYPTASTTKRFSGFDGGNEGYTYVPFNNVWGIRNLSRTRSLKRALRPFLAQEGEKLILAYCPHTPFVKAAAYAKRLDPLVRTCLYVPDLPQYMNLSAKVSPIYKFAKFFDIRSMTKAMRFIDSFVLLTEEMKHCLPVGDKPYLVSEGLITEDALKEAKARLLSKEPTDGKEKTVVYTGKLDCRFGIPALLEAMRSIDEPECRLVLCGTGDAMHLALAAAKEDARIRVLGQVPPSEAAALQKNAAVLVNPRGSSEEYTKYSFPSKNLEYLLSGAAVVAHRLSGMPEIYDRFLFAPKGDSPEALAEAIRAALGSSREEREQTYRAFLAYAEEHLLATQVANAILR